MLPSKGDSKHEARFVARLDVLTERVDTLASTVATTASAIAKKDGEIASLRRELQLRDEQLRALAAQTQAPAGADPRDLQELRQAVAALANERAKQGGSKQLDELTGKVGLLWQRVETLSATVSTTASGLAGREGELAAIRKRLENPLPSGAVVQQPDPALKQLLDELTSTAASTKARLDGHAAQLEAVKAKLGEPHAHAEELRATLATLRSRVESLAGLHVGVTEEQLDERLADTASALDRLGERVNALASDVESATTHLSEKEDELAALHRHFLESSTRIESIVDDLREALAAFPEAGPELLTTLGAQLEAATKSVAAVTSRVERLESVRAEGLVAELAGRLDLVDKRVAEVAADIARAKTLWPVALRSLEARLDDVVPGASAEPRPLEAPSADATPDPHDDADDLLAELRDSLKAMESVAAELERSSESSSADDAPAAAPSPPQQALAGGARIVPLRTVDP